MSLSCGCFLFFVYIILIILLRVTRDNFLHAVRDINEETIVVDLDRNVITMRENTPDLPPIPLSRRSKLEAVLDQVASPVFWSARGLSQSNVEILKSQKDVYTIKRLTDSAELVWKKKLRSYDDAFNIVDVPSNLSYQVDVDYISEHSTSADDSTNKWDVVQESFLRFFVSMLKDYRNFLSAPHEINERDRWKSIRTFHSQQFIETQRADIRPFLAEFCRTQLFDDFITRRVASHADELDMIFFDQSITAKLNRSKMTLKKKKTPFLKYANAHKRLRVVEAVQPNSDGLPIELEHKDPCYPDDINTLFSYPSWPETFTEAYFGPPRMIPKILSQYDRKDTVTFKSSEDYTSNHELRFDPGAVSSSLEAASFTVFFIIYCDMIGRQHSSFKIVKDSSTELPLNNEMDMNGYGHVHAEPSVDFLCGCDSFAPLAWCEQLFLKDIFNYSWIWGIKEGPGDVDRSINQPLEGVGGSNGIFDMNISQDVDERLNFAYSIIDMMKVRKVNVESELLKSLFKAAIRCGSRGLVIQMFEALQARGIKMNEDLYSSPSSFDQSDAMMMISPSTSATDSSIHHVSSSFDINRNSSLSDNDNVSKSWIARYSLSHSISSSLGRKSQFLTKKDKLSVTDEVSRKLVEGKHLWLDLFGDLKIETNDICPQCSRFLNEDELMLGWNVCDVYDCTTQCPKCFYRFVACFVVKSANTEFIGSQGKSTPLYCEFISPWILQRELHGIIQQEPNGACAILDPDWRHKSDLNAAIYWNLIVTFERHMIPYSFLLRT